MESWVTCVMGFIPANFQLPMPFHSRLRVRYGTDRQTDRQWSSMHNAPYGGGGVIVQGDETETKQTGKEDSDSFDA